MASQITVNDIVIYCYGDNQKYTYEIVSSDTNTTLIKSQFVFGYDAQENLSMWTHDMGFEFPDANGRPMLTKRARCIASTDNVGKALNGYRYLQNEKATGKINDENYKLKLLQLYNESS